MGGVAQEIVAEAFNRSVERSIWLPVLVYRTIADPADGEGITRNMLKATFCEERSAGIDYIVDTLIKVGAVSESDDVLTAVPYEPDDE